MGLTKKKKKSISCLNPNRQRYQETAVLYVAVTTIFAQANVREMQSISKGT